MCRFDSHGARPGARLADGEAHRDDHRSWTRRSFVHALGLSAAAGAGVVAGLPVRTFARSWALEATNLLATDRVLVLIQLNGGNDGINTVVPYRQDVYFSARPTLAHPYRDIIQLTAEVGLHPALVPFEARFGNGTLGIVQGVGYASPSLSHFRSTDIWLTGRSGSDEPDTGWVGRSLDAEFPGFETDPPDYPLAVQFGGTSPLLTEGPDRQMGVSIQSIELFERLSGTGQLYRTDDLKDGPKADQMRFVRTVANDSFRYAGALQRADTAVENDVPYPPGNGLADQLAIVSRLIRGNLGARIYHVSLGGFDTHSNQAAAHATLMDRLGSAVEAFVGDLAYSGHDGRVLIATFSEFGRRVNENGSAGTDHGTAAPLFLIGSGARGGLHGSIPDLSDLDAGGNLRFGIDYRSVFGSLLRDWFGVPDATVSQVLGADWPALDLVSSPTSTGARRERPADPHRLAAPFPNPFAGRTTLPLHLGSAGPVRVTVHDVAGRLVRVLVDAVLPAGAHPIAFDGAGLPAGTYVVRVSASGRVLSRPAVLLR